MNDVYIGKGKIDGRGVYANRDFAEGEAVTRWNLRPLHKEALKKLSKSEQKFVHSFWGKMYLFDEPSRYTNHSAAPNTRANFIKQQDVALRPIRKNEMITTNATEEIMFELTTFLEAYERAANSRDFNNVESLISDDAVFIFTNGTFEGKPSIQQAFEETWNKIQNETYTISEVFWVKRGYRNAICEYVFTSDGIVNGKRQIYKGKGVNTLKRIDGSWQIVREHLSLS